MLFRSNSAEGYHYLAYLYRLCDMTSEAREALERSIQLNPYVPWEYRAIARLEAMHGRFDEARKWLEREREKCGVLTRPGLEAVVRMLEGRYAEALAWREEGREPSQPISGETLHDALLHLLNGNRERALESFNLGKPFAEIDMDWAAVAAEYLAQAGGIDGAFRALYRAAELGNDMLAVYERSRFLEPLRTDPRWAPFIEGVRRRVAEYKREFRWPPVAA